MLRKNYYGWPLTRAHRQDCWMWVESVDIFQLHEPMRTHCGCYLDALAEAVYLHLLRAPGGEAPRIALLVCRELDPQEGYAARPE